MSGCRAREDWVKERSDCRVRVEKRGAEGVRVMWGELSLCFKSPNPRSCVINFEDTSL